MNKVVLIGRLTKDPEIRYTNNQLAIATFTLAIDRFSRNSDEKKADFPRVTCFGKTAQLVEQYVQKGQQVALDGSLQTGSYKDSDGKTIYTTDVIADRVEFLGSAKGKGESSANTVPNPLAESGFEALDEDVPF